MHLYDCTESVEEGRGIGLGDSCSERKVERIDIFSMENQFSDEI
jgi:hypothetical protein